MPRTQQAHFEFDRINYCVFSRLSDDFSGKPPFICENTLGDRHRLRRLGRSF